MYGYNMNPYIRTYPFAGYQPLGSSDFLSKFKGVAIGLAGGTVVGMVARNFEDRAQHKLGKLGKDALVPAAASLSALILYGLIG